MAYQKKERSVNAVKKIKSICVVLLTLLLSICSMIPVFAEEARFNEIIDHRGSISISLKADDFALAEVEMTVFRIADAAFNDRNELEFNFIPELCEFGPYPNENDADTLRKLAAYAWEHEIPYQKVNTDEDGLAVFTGIETGAYLVVQTGHAEGFTTCSPFIIALPIIEEDGPVYDIDASPKNDVERLVDISVKKVWNDVGNNLPSSVEIRLLKDGEEIGTAVLSDGNNWSHIWENQLQSDAYSIEEINVPVGWHASYSNHDYSYIVTNSSKLIQTGQHKLPVLIMAVIGLFFFIAGWAAIYAENRKEHE